MEPVAAKVFEFSKNKEVGEHFFPEIPEKELEEAIAILGLDQPAFSFSGDYDWMVETTKQILRREGIDYFRGNILTLMKAWDDYSKS